MPPPSLGVSWKIPAPMFAKPKPPTPAPPPKPRPFATAIATLTNPYVGASAAAFTFLAAAASLVFVTGDPKAATPTVRLSLAHVGDTSGPPGWKAALPQEPAGDAPFDQ